MQLRDKDYFFFQFNLNTLSSHFREIRYFDAWYYKWRKSTLMMEHRGVNRLTEVVFDHPYPRLPPTLPSFYIASWETTVPESRSRSRSSTLLSSTGSGLPSIQFVSINRLVGFFASSRPTGRAIFLFARLIFGVLELRAKYRINITFKIKKKKKFVTSHFSLLIRFSIFSRS